MDFHLTKRNHDENHNITTLSSTKWTSHNLNENNLNFNPPKTPKTLSSWYPCSKVILLYFIQYDVFVGYYTNLGLQLTVIFIID